MIPKNQDKIIFYINNYINYNQLNLLYDLNQLKNYIRNINIVVYKFGPTLIKVINQKLQIVKKKNRKKEEILEKLGNKNYS